MLLCGCTQLDKRNLTGGIGFTIPQFFCSASPLDTTDFTAQNAISDTCGLRKKCYGGILGDGWYIFSLPTSVYGWWLPPSVRSSWNWKFLATAGSLPTPTGQARQQHFRECRSEGGGTEKETNSREPRKLSRAWEWKASYGWEDRRMRRLWIYQSQVWTSLWKLMVHISTV